MSQLVDQSLGKPIQGVSQQAESLRSRGQCNEQINFMPDPVTGLPRRPHTTISRVIAEYDKYMDYTDSEGDKLLCIKSDAVDVYTPDDNTLTPVTITDTEAHDYLKQGTSALSSAFVADNLYIGNREITVTEDTTYVPPVRTDDASIVFCLGGLYSKEYQVKVTLATGQEITASFTTPDGTTTGDVDLLQSTHIASQLYTQLNASSFLTCKLHLDHILITAASSYTITSVTCSDDEGGVSLKCAFGSVKVIEDLPAYAAEGTVITIAGEFGNEDDAYFEFLPLDAGSATGLDTFGLTGSWVETVKVGDEFEFDKTTLPMRLTNDGGYSLELADWKGREIGDAESSETPSLLNKTVRDLAVLQGRLGILSEDSVLFSRTKRPTELWRRSIVGGLQNNDAIDGDGDASTGIHTYFAKNAQDLSVFSLQGQYVILGNTQITPDTVNLSRTTRNTSAPNVPPIGVAGSLYYMTDGGDYLGMNEYFKEDTTYFSQQVSAHVPRYVEGNAVRVKGCNPQKLVAVQTDASDTTLYCYKFLFDGKKKLQSAWFKLEFNNPIEYYFFTGNRLIIITDNNGEHVIETMAFDTVIGEGLEFNVHLDRSKVYTLDAQARITPDAIHTNEDVVFVSISENSRGLVTNYEDNGDGTYTIADGLENDKVVAGYRYTSLYSPTSPRVFDRKNEVIQTGELNVRNLLVNVSRSGVFKYKVTADYGQIFEGGFTNRVWGEFDNRVGEEPLFSKQWKIPWRGKASSKTCEIICNEHTPLNINYIEFTGDLRKTRQRL